MNEEEKIEILKNKFLKYHLEYKDEEMLLNYIKKLQQENEELKEDNKVLCEMVFIRPMPFLYTTPVLTSTDAYVSKDKVKDVVNNFIEELNDLLGE